MVVKPEDLERVLNEHDSKVLAEFERSADRVLEERYVPGHDVSIGVPTGARNYRKVVQEIVNRYGAAGWEVKEVSDQRDGDYLSFKARRRA